MAKANRAVPPFQMVTGSTTESQPKGEQRDRCAVTIGGQGLWSEKVVKEPGQTMLCGRTFHTEGPETGRLGGWEQPPATEEQQGAGAGQAE